jgi:hypothetical protein
MAEFSLVKESAEATGIKKRKENNRIRPGKNEPYLPVMNTVLQRKPLCSCDGGCPRCTGVVQSKLTIGRPDDKYEQEADRVAERVMSMGDDNCVQCGEDRDEGIQTKPISEQITPLVQRQEEEPEEEEEEPPQAKAFDNLPLQRQGEETEEEEPVSAKPSHNNTPTLSADFKERMDSLGNGGRPLSDSVRTYFEPRFGTDFGNVRIHTDANAARTAKSINSKAFTKGNDIVFGEGQFSPGTTEGKQLLAHELTHVIQQKKNKT